MRRTRRARLILTKDVPELGRKGDVVEVAPGYARNYLVPQSLAVKATAGSLQQAEAMRQAREEAERRLREEAEGLKEALAMAHVVVAARASDEGKLFGSIGPSDAAEAIYKFTGIEIDRKVIQIFDPIKEIGLHEVTLAPHPEVEFHVTIDVIPA